MADIQPWCPPNTAIDNIMTNSVQTTCTVNVMAYIVLGAIISAWRMAVAIYHWKNWHTRERRLRASLQGRDRESRRHRLPIAPLNSFTSAILCTIFFACTATNIISFRDGSALLVFAIWAVSYQIFEFFFFMRVLRLGKAIIPLLRNDESENASLLSRPDQVIMMLSTIFAMLIIIGPCIGIVHMATRGQYIQLNMAWFIVAQLSQITIFALLIWQMQRVISTIRALQYNNSADQSSRIAIHRLQSQQRFFLCSFTSLFMTLSAGVAGVFVWWVVLINALLDPLVLSAVIASEEFTRVRRHAAAAAKRAIVGSGRDDRVAVVSPMGSKDVGSNELGTVSSEKVTKQEMEQ